ncbi:MAG: sporulation transcriptional regulator SpoIIID, partial [Clostridia bacterium]|nr:sporulation transcriptional regulator SpoIIID [Clostridia bacterium]
LAAVNRALFLQVRALLDRNKAERHLRGGEATRNKYRARRSDPPAGEKNRPRRLHQQA